jgi:hypothetical protein
MLSSSLGRAYIQKDSLSNRNQAVYQLSTTVSGSTRLLKMALVVKVGKWRLSWFAGKGLDIDLLTVALWA